MTDQIVHWIQSLGQYESYLFGAASAVFLLTGNTLVRRSLQFTAFSFGCAVSLLGLLWLHEMGVFLPWPVQIIATAFTGWLALASFKASQQLALRGGGVLIGLLSTLILFPNAPLWAPVAGAAIGFFLFPVVLNLLWTGVTALMGAYGIAVIGGFEHTPVLLAALAVVGVIAQLSSGSNTRPTTDR